MERQSTGNVDGSPPRSVPATSRRGLLATISAGTLGAVAGCLGGQNDSDGGTCSGEQLTDLEAPARGDADAPIAVTVYSDFACPHCATFALDKAPTLDDDIADGRVRYVHRDFPIPVSEEWSRPAANAARAVQYHVDDASFFEYTHGLYRNQDRLGTELFGDLADDVDAPREDVVAAAKDRPFCEVISEDRQNGIDRGVEGTPTVFVNDRKLVNPSAEELRTAVDEADG